MPKAVPIHDQTHAEIVDVLAPPRFEPTGETKTAKEAIAAGNWLGSFNIWLYSRTPEPSIIYQLRSPHALWEPNKLDVTAAGYYSAGEARLDGLRELHEELGIDIPADQVQFFGRKLFASVDAKSQERRAVAHVYLAEYTGILDDMTLEEYEVAGIVCVPLKPLIEVFAGTRTSFDVQGFDAYKQAITYTVKKDSFPYNFDDYQRKMAEYIALKLGVDDAYIRD